MSLQSRKRRNQRGSRGVKALLVGGVVLAVVLVIGSIAAVGYVLNVAQSAPVALQPAPDPDRRLLAGLRLRRHPPRLHPVRPAALSRRLERNPGEPQERDGRDRGPALLQTRRRRPDGHLPRGHQGRHDRLRRAGRVDDHDAAGAQPLSRRRSAHAAPEDHRGQAGARLRETPQQEVDPHQLPEQRPLRHGRRSDGGGRPGRGARLLQQARLPAGPRAGGAARRPPAGALRVQPVPGPGGREGPAQRGPRQDGRTALHHPRPGRRRPSRTRSRSTTATSTPSAKRTSSSNTCASSW